MAIAIGEIKNKFKDIPTHYGIMEYADEIKAYEEFIADIAGDTRQGVIAIKNQAEKRINDIYAELERVKQMTAFEQKYAECEYIGGIDEVGRGPFAGPIVASCVVLPKDVIIPYLNDSKQVKAERREELCEIIKKYAVSYGVGVSSEKVIDEEGINEANYKAMRSAIDQLSVKPDLLLIDAVTLPKTDIKQIAIVKGDTLSVSIAAASILGKVTRDKMMEEYAKLYPEYGFDKNVGYGTAEHRAALKKYGPCEIHRRTFIKNHI